eukprot:3479960-Prymnesium_polylepis.1
MRCAGRIPGRAEPNAAVRVIHGPKCFGAPGESECVPRRRNMIRKPPNQGPRRQPAPRAAVSLALGCRLSVSDHCMDVCPITVWYGAVSQCSNTTLPAA